MTIANIHYAKTHLSRLLAQVGKGQEIIIAKAGKPVAELAPLEPQKKEPRRSGGLLGQIETTADFDAEDPEINRLFYEGDDSLKT